MFFRSGWAALLYPTSLPPLSIVTLVLQEARVPIPPPCLSAFPHHSLAYVYIVQQKISRRLFPLG